ncbi:MAG: class I SAM-dependent methyltransferase [Candidatus Sericytochromatia bacterium]
MNSLLELARKAVAARDYSLALYQYNHTLSALVSKPVDPGLAELICLEYLDLLEELNFLPAAEYLCHLALRYFSHQDWPRKRLVALQTRLQADYTPHSNLVYWQQMQEQGYFDTHAQYVTPTGLWREGRDLERIQRYLSLDKAQLVAVIGCGYGRESALICPHVGHVWGIDVTTSLLARAQADLQARGITNFTPVLAADWSAGLPDKLDLVYCYTVFQHLTKHLVVQYIEGLADRLSPGGHLVCQFLQATTGLYDAELGVYEPQVSWSDSELQRLFGRSGYQILHYDREAKRADLDWIWIDAIHPEATIP